MHLKNLVARFGSVKTENGRNVMTMGPGHRVQNEFEMQGNDTLTFSGCSPASPCTMCGGGTTCWTPL